MESIQPTLLDAGRAVKSPAATHGPQHRRVTWKDLCELEPRLAALYSRAKSVEDDKHQPSFCANAAWYGRAQSAGFKEKLVELVGWRRNHPVLGTSLAYDISYDKIYSALPFCRNCACVNLWGFVQRRLIDE